MTNFYDCATCEDKNCKACPACGKNPKSLDTTDNYRSSVKKGYYSSSLIEVRDADGKFIRYAYNKPGE